MVTSVTTATFLTVITKVNMVKRKINDNIINHGKHDANGTMRIHVRARTPHPQIEI